MFLNQMPMGFPFPGQPPTATIYPSQQYGAFNPQVQTSYHPASRGQSLPAAGRQYPPVSSRRNGHYPPPPAPSQNYEYHRHESRGSKKHRKRRSVSPGGAADQSLYSDKEKDGHSRSPSPKSTGDRSKDEAGAGQTHTETDQPSQVAGSASGEPSQGAATTIEEQQNSPAKEERQSRSKTKKHHHRHEQYHTQYQQPPPPPPPSGPFFGELPPQMRVHQQPLYSGYNQAYEESIRRGDVFHKQIKRSTRLPPEAKQQLLPHEEDRQKQYPFPGYPQQAYRPPFNPYQPGYFAPPPPTFNGPQPWPNAPGPNHGPAEQEIQRLRSHIHTLEGELHKLQKKLTKASVNNDGSSRGSHRSKPDEIQSPRQTPVIVELNDGDGNRETSSKKKHRHRNGSSQQGPNPIPTAGENNIEQNVSNQQHVDARDRSRSGGQQISESDPKSAPKSAREETAAQLAHAAAAHVNARQQIPPPPPVQGQYVYPQGGFRGPPPPHFPPAGNVHYPHDPYQQPPQHNFNQSNNNELPDHNGERRHRRSADKILDAFERFYMTKSTTAPMKVKYIPEDNHHSHHQRNSNNNNNNNNYRDRSISRYSSSSD